MARGFSEGHSGRQHIPYVPLSFPRPSFLPLFSPPPAPPENSWGQPGFALYCHVSVPCLRTPHLFMLLLSFHKKLIYNPMTNRSRKWITPRFPNKRSDMYRHITHWCDGQCLSLECCEFRVIVHLKRKKISSFSLVLFLHHWYTII